MTDHHSNPPDVTIVHDVAELRLPRGEKRVSSMVMIYGEFLGRRFEVDGESLTIGRSPDCSIQLADDSVSRQHCRVTPADEGAIILDLGSTNGTYVNGTSVSARHLRDGDSVQVGRSIFKFLTGSNIEQAYHEEIYRLKTTDGLTGANNKRAFEEELQREFHRFLRYHRPIVLVMFDIDHFKNVNDSYGHQVGDEVLVAFAQAAREVLRDTDLIARWGGEEFLIILPDTHEASKVLQALERLQARLRTSVVSETVPALRVSFSAGYALWSAPEDVDVLLQRADRALYVAKNAGRDRCVQAD